MFRTASIDEGKFHTIDNEELRVDRSDGNAYSKADFIQVGVTCIGWQVMLATDSEFVISIDELSHRYMVERRNGMLRRCTHNLQKTKENLTMRS